MENNKKCGHEPRKGRESEEERRRNTLFGSSMDLGVIRIHWGAGRTINFMWGHKRHSMASWENAGKSWETGNCNCSRRSEFYAVESIEPHECTFNFDTLTGA